MKEVKSPKKAVDLLLRNCAAGIDCSLIWLYLPCLDGASGDEETDYGTFMQHD